ncbi:hypothetical protein, partial [Microbulbifer elongatus]|uniref:hypothetical protein n=1 Tax=Microbulbifer elongatus TaxID=86173 RepID=UPI00210ED9FA
WATASTGSCGGGSGGGGGYYYGGPSGGGSGFRPAPTGASGVETLRCEPPPCADGSCNKDNTSPE